MQHTPAESQKKPSKPHAADPNFWPSVLLSVFFMSMLPVIMVMVMNARPHQTVPTSIQPVELSDQSVAFALAKQRAAGLEVYKAACVVCHGDNAQGVSRLGKPLRNSAYVQEHDHDSLFELIRDGRTIDDPLNTTGALMPVRGAIGLDDEQIDDVIAYLRSLQDPDAATVSVADWEIKSADGTVEQVAVQLTEHPGYQLYLSSCAACHGEGAEGIEQLGLPLTTSGFVRGESDDALVKFIKSGRPMWDVNNSTGIDMPPKGGNPAITDDQLYQIVEYMRALQEQALASN